jgi:hypothetical protein
MKRLLLATGFVALLASSAPAGAEPAISGGADDRPTAGLQPSAAGERWFFGDGGFGCPLWWCDDAGLAPDRPRQADASERWFFGDGGFGYPLWWCDDAGLAPDRPRQAEASERWFFGDGGFGCPLWWCDDRFDDQPAGRAEP